MKRMLIGILGALAIVAFASKGFAMVVGEVAAQANGTGVITFDVSSSGDPSSMTDSIQKNLRLSNGAEVQSVQVKDGVATIEFAKASGGAQVTASLPDEIVAALGAGGGGGSMTAAYVGAGALVVTGGTLVGLAAAGEFDGNGTEKKQPTGSIGQ